MGACDSVCSKNSKKPYPGQNYLGNNPEGVSTPKNNSITKTNKNISNKDNTPQVFIRGKPEPIGRENEEKINQQMKKSICKIIVNKNYGTGFLCKIPFPDEFSFLPVLITNKSIINKDKLQRIKKIEITLDNERVSKTIDISSERKIYSCEKYDITFIEIIPKIDDINYFMETRTSNIVLEKNGKSVYVLQYIKNNNIIKIFKSPGIMDEINGSIIKHNCSKIKGGPILLLDDLKLIGINIGNGQGILLKEPINDLYSYFETIRNKQNPMNCIDCYYIINNGNEFNLLNDYSYLADSFECEKEYIETKKIKTFLENNINIYIDSQPINFIYKYKSNNNRIHVKFIFKQLLNDLSFLFFGCKNLESIDLTSYDTSNITNMFNMFTDCENLKTVDLSSLKTNNYINMGCLFSNCTALEIINFPSVNKINITNLGQSFYECKSLESLNLSSFNTIKVKDMSSLFCGCSSLKSINISSFKTDNVVDMKLLFHTCQNLRSLDLSNFNTKNVKNMLDMFFDCRALTTLDLFSFNTYNVESMRGMFGNCLSLRTINLSSFNTINVKDMTFMFSGCNSLRTLNLSSFNTINVENICLMFLGCEQLETLDLSLFNTKNVNKKNNIIGNQLFQLNFPTNNIFLGCSNLKSIKCKDEYILDMFHEVKQLENFIK